ncbi:hypothetical protein Pint_09427 [Pistacia integerrima]|uniref:Uncharacterized protein n=1 Tax=Pistacia integerrima TaxID=434235 RepID=A0ACC0XF53_9ROSI|nr:hypothetical protein Pint_09427 [Pistacia integerrima]
MEEQNVVRMVLKVDLQCEKCYRKVKKVLYKFPRKNTRSRCMTRRQNTVTIKVVCYSPERMKQNICYEGGESIKSIEILPPPKPKEPEKPKEKPAPAKVKPPKQDKPKVTFVDPLPNPAPYFPPSAYRNQCPTCCREWYEGRGGGPGYQRDYYGPPTCRYCGYNEKPVYDSWGVGGGGDSYRANRFDCFSEENPNAACRIM